MNMQDKRYRERYMNRTPDMTNRITLTAGGAPGSGKTSLLMLILDMMADMGLLAHHETRRITQSPRDHFAEARVMNGDSEAIEVMIDRDALAEARSALETFRDGVVPEPIELYEMPADKMTMITDPTFKGVEGKVEIDPFLLSVMSQKEALILEFSKLIDAVEQVGLPLLPLRLTFDIYTIPAD